MDRNHRQESKAIRVEHVQVPLEDGLPDLKKAAAAALNISSNEIRTVKIVRRSLDARRKNRIHFVYTLDVELPEQILRRINVKNAAVVSRTELPVETLKPGSQNLWDRPVIVGAGPSGLFAALTLTQAGYRPVLIDRGKKVEDRTRDVERFWHQGSLCQESNVAFGEGGAGTFSDGKLTTRIKNHRVQVVLDELIKAGAPAEIRYEQKPHLGTDQLKRILVSIRQYLLDHGCDIRYSAKMTGLHHQDGAVRSIEVNGCDQIPSQVLLLCTGHSARDTYRMLFESGVPMEPKAFSVGLRVEHPQEMIDRIQYGQMAGHPLLPPAEYQLADRSRSGRGVYTFCMCPGGFVVGASTEADHLVVNGMSLSARGGKNANAAVVCTVDHRDLNSRHPLAGIEFQREWEQAAYSRGGGGFRAPAQNLKGFMQEGSSRSIQTTLVEPSYRPGVEPASLSQCLPVQVVGALQEGIQLFDRKMRGFAHPDAILTGIETRTSAPLRIPRNQQRVSIGLEGIYPVGEGAGYAGGIMSAAVDGIETAEAVIGRYARPKN